MIMTTVELERIREFDDRLGSDMTPFLPVMRDRRALLNHLKMRELERSSHLAMMVVLIKRLGGKVDIGQREFSAAILNTALISFPDPITNTITLSVETSQ